jgi:hypothetical protein
MEQYQFQTREFAISEEGVHFLRSGFNYRTIPFSEINSFKISRGHLLKKWRITLVFGLALFFFSLYLILGLFNFFNSAITRTVYIEELLIPLFPFLTGAYCIYASLQKGTVLTFTRKGKQEQLPLVEIEKSGQLESMQQYLARKTRLLY